MADMDKIEKHWQWADFKKKVEIHAKEPISEAKMREHYTRFLYQQNMKKHKKKYRSKNGTIIKCVHEDGCYRFIGKLVEDFNPELVLELGYSWGGMTKLFEDYTSKKTQIKAYNWKCGREANKSNFSSRVEFIKADLLKEPLKGLVNFCKDKRKKLLYCDNGNKIKEVYMYGQHLNVGDMIGAHDYPKEIYHDWDMLIGKTKLRDTREDVDNMNKVLADFEPVEHDLFLEKGFSDRFWIKVR